MNDKPQKKQILVFSSGGKQRGQGGSGFEWLVRATKTGVLDAEIVGVVSNHRNGGVHERAEKLGIPFRYMPAPYDATSYQAIIAEFQPDLVCLSGWLKKVLGLLTKMVINIHPGFLTPEFSGQDKHGHFVHEAVLAAHCDRSAVSMHFVDENFDTAKYCFFEYPVAVLDGDSAEDIARNVNEVEHAEQAPITDLVAQGLIHLHNGRVCVPRWYYYLPFCPKHPNIEVYD